MRPRQFLNGAGAPGRIEMAALSGGHRSQCGVDILWLVPDDPLVSYERDGGRGVALGQQVPGCVVIQRDVVLGEFTPFRERYTFTMWQGPQPFEVKTLMAASKSVTISFLRKSGVPGIP